LQELKSVLIPALPNVGLGFQYAQHPSPLWIVSELTCPSLMGSRCTIRQVSLQKELFDGAV
jgi:hypothetical protein